MSNQSWDNRFMEMALLVASWSKDRNTHVGCIIVGPQREVRSVGYNGFPRGVNDEVEARFERPLKYMWTEHAERNAIYNSSRMGLSLEGCTMYLNGDHGFPCTDCARAIIQCGIKFLVGLAPDFDNPKYGAEYRNTITMFQEAGMAFRSIEKETK
jgi:dCMP deaminase